MSSYLIALPVFKGARGFNHPTILVSAKSREDAITQALNHHPKANIGDIKIVNY